MGRAPCCDKTSVKKGPWSPEEDAKLKAYLQEHGTGGNWIALPPKIGLKRCGKSCRLRWLNYLRPNLKHGGFSEEEDNIICNLYVTIGSRWSIIAAQLPGRTDNDIKNYWNTRLKKKLLNKQRKELQEARLKQEMAMAMAMNRQNQTDQNNLNMFGETFMKQEQTLYWPQMELPMTTYNSCYGQAPSSSSDQEQKHTITVPEVIKIEKTNPQETISAQNPLDFSFDQDLYSNFGGVFSAMNSSTNSPLPSSQCNGIPGRSGHNREELLQWFGNFQADEAMNYLLSSVQNLEFYENSAMGTTSNSADQSTISWEDTTSLVCTETNQSKDVSYFGNGIIYKG